MSAAGGTKELQARLAHLLAGLIENDRDRALKPSQRTALEAVVAEHLDDFLVLPWIERLLEQLVSGTTTGRIEIPEAMEWDGGGSLSNLILRVSAEVHRLDFDDYGEGVVWKLARSNLRLFLCREASPYFYEIGRIDADQPRR